MEPASDLRLVIVALRGADRGKFGWVLYTDDLLVQSRRKFDSREAAEADAAEFQKPGEALH